MKKKAKDLEFISWINRDGNGTKLNNEFSKDQKFRINILSISQKTYIASGFNSFVVRLKNK
jgi:hypothetical protein